MFGFAVVAVVTGFVSAPPTRLWLMTQLETCAACGHRDITLVKVAVTATASRRAPPSPSTRRGQRSSLHSADTNDACGSYNTREDRLEGPSFGLLGQNSDRGLPGIAGTETVRRCRS
jgi:hypothetical protein